MCYHFQTLFFQPKKQSWKNRITISSTVMTRSSRARDLSGTEKKSSKCATWPGARLEWDFGNSEKLTVYPSQIDVWSTWMFFERSFHFFVLCPSFTSSFSTVFGSLRSFCLKYSRKLPRQKQCVTWPEFYHFWKQGVCATWPSARLDRVIAVLLRMDGIRGQRDSVLENISGFYRVFERFQQF